MLVHYKGFNTYPSVDKAVYEVDGKAYESRIYSKLVNDAGNTCKWKRQYFFYHGAKKLVINNLFTEQTFNI